MKAISAVGSSTQCDLNSFGHGLPVIHLDNVSKVFGGSHRITVQRDLLDIVPAEFVGVVSSSGAGRLTFLNLIGGSFGRPDCGTIELDGIDIGPLEDGELTCVCSNKIFFIFQCFNLLRSLTN